MQLNIGKHVKYLVSGPQPTYKILNVGNHHSYDLKYAMFLEHILPQQKIINIKYSHFLQLENTNSILSIPDLRVKTNTTVVTEINLNNKTIVDLL